MNTSQINVEKSIKEETIRKTTTSVEKRDDDFEINSRYDYNITYKIQNN